MPAAPQDRTGSRLEELRGGPVVVAERRRAGRRLRKIVSRVQAVRPDDVVCVSTSGRVFRSFDERAEVLDLDGDLGPDLASPTLGSLNLPAPDEARRLIGLAARPPACRR